MNVTGFKAGYLHLHREGVLADRIETVLAALASCELCPRRCRVNRLQDERGICRTGRSAVVASYNPHFGEEQPLVGGGGSGTIFFSHCNLHCVFCQNYEISHDGEGVAASAGQLAAMMVSLQKQGCHNINFVTPSHVAAQILEALPIAIDRGLTVPLVYNTSGYDRVETLQLLDGIIDIYMPDFKFWNPQSARRFAKALDYPQVARAAIREMHRQVGDLVVDEEGIAQCGLLVRHLVMPGGLAETGKILDFIAREISPDTHVNVMDQYRPCGAAHDYPPIDRMLRQEEYQEAIRLAHAAGLTRLDRKDMAAILRFLGII